MLAVVGAMVAGLVAALVQGASASAGGTASTGGPPVGPDPLHALLLTFAMLLLVWMAAWPYFAARAQQIVWGHTLWAGEVGFAGQMRAKGLWKLAIGQTALTLLPAGLYWPFAAVAIARYRIESVEVVAPRPLGELAVTATPAAGRAAGDGAADLFGLDLGW